MASKPYTRQYTVGAVNPVQIVPPSPNRIALIVGQPQGGTIMIGPNADVSATSGIAVSSGDPPLNLKKCDYGCLVQGPLYAISVSGTVTGVVVETVEG